MWYVAQDGISDGPFDLESLLARYRAGEVSELDLVWREGLDNWCPLWDVPEFRQALKEAQFGAVAGFEGALSRGIERDADEGAPGMEAVSGDGRSPRRETGHELSGEPATKPEAAKGQRPLTGNFLLDHWRGNYSLAVSYWIVGVGGSILGLGAAYAFGILMQYADIPPAAVGGSLVAFLALLLAATVWQLIGVWRSAGNSFRGGRLVWPFLARAMVVLGALRLGAEFATVIGPMAWESVQIAVVGDQIPAGHLTIEEDGRIITLAGGITYGTSTRFETLLDASKKVRVVRLDSIGGLFHEAQKISALVRRNGLTTFTNAECSSACTAILLGAGNRVVAEGAKVGFHSMSFGSLDETRLPGMSEPARRFYVEHGLPEGFVNRVLSVPTDRMEYVADGQLVELNVATRVVPRAFDYRRLAYRPAEMARLIVASDSTRLPLRLDKLTELTDLAADNERVVYTYTVKAKIEELDLKRFESRMLKRLSDGACRDEGMRRALDDGVAYLHRYVTARGRHVADLIIDGQGCQK